MNKQMLAKMNEVHHILTERDVLTATRSEWLVKLLYAFQDVHFVYLAMEYAPGGDLRTLMNNSGILLQKHIRFYAMEMLMAANALHEIGFIHRDLKPENFLVDATGHVKLVDFGLSKGFLDPAKLDTMKRKMAHLHVTKRPSMELRTLHKTLLKQQRAYSLVGSPDYMAPEILSGLEYNKNVDYWSLGCIIYEFFAGYPPFTAEEAEQVWENVVHWRDVLDRPEFDVQAATDNLSDDAWDFILHLLVEAHERLSSVEQAKSHPFFGPIQWTRQVKPPFIPKLESDKDTHYFDDFTSEADLDLYKQVMDKYQKIDEMEAADVPALRNAFIGFTFKQKKKEESLRDLSSLVE
jgi:serine/threonine protein kinase